MEMEQNLDRRSAQSRRQGGRRGTEKADRGFLAVQEPRIGRGKFKNQTGIRSADLRKVREIAGEAFAGCANLREVQLRNIWLISRYSFSRCIRLQELELPAGLSYMGTGAFMDNKRLEAVRFHRDSSLAALPNLTFSGCEALKTVQFPKRLQSIGRRAFYKCGSLSDAELPLSLKVIGAEAFYGCGLDELELHHDPGRLEPAIVRRACRILCPSGGHTQFPDPKPWDYCTGSCRADGGIRIRKWQPACGSAASAGAETGKKLVRKHLKTAFGFVMRLSAVALAAWFLDRRQVI